MRRLSLLPSAPLYPTASELRIAGECVAPWALGLPEERETNEWAEHGRRMHAAVERLGMVQAWGSMIEDMGLSEREVAMLDDCKTILCADREAAKRRSPGSPATEWHVEQGIKWRTDGFDDEAEFCERAPGERLRGWFAGTADLVYVRHDNLLVVADWKFGPREHVNGEPAKESCQGFFLALAFAAKLGITGSSAGVVVARFERRMVFEDGIEVDGHDITQGELDAFAEQLRALAKRIDSAVDAMPRISAACGKCKAKAECPAWQEVETHAVVAVSGSGIDCVINLRAPKTDDDVRVLQHSIDAVERYRDEWKRLRDAYVLTHPEGVPVGLGMKLKAIPTKDRELVDTPEGLDVIERIVPGSIIVQRKATIASIKAAARDAAGKDKTSTSDRAKTKDAVEKEAFEALIAAGAVIDKGKKLTVRVVRSDDKEW